MKKIAVMMTAMVIPAAQALASDEAAQSNAASAMVSYNLQSAAAVADGQTVNVADYGIVPGRDVTFALNALIASLEGTSNVTLSFPEGQYDFHPERAFEEYRYVANHDNGLKRMAFPIFGADNLTIDGNGSLFMFHGRIVPFTVHESHNVTLQNLTIDFIRPFHAELKVIESDAEARSFTATIDTEQHPYEIKDGEIFFERFGQMDPIGSNIVFDPETRSPIYNTRQYNVPGTGLKVRELSEGVIHVPRVRGTPPPVGSVMIVYGVHPTSRLTPAIHVTNSKDIKLDNVTVLAAGGMALIVERTENVHLDGFRVTSSETRTVATRADATHFIGTKGHILMENSVLEHMLDDGINVHGAYVNIDEYLGGNRFMASISHFQQMGFEFGEAGDKVAMLSRETVLPFFETSITSVTPVNEKRFLVTLADVPEELPVGPLSLENLTWNADVTMRNNRIQENRARSALITTKGTVLIEGNIFNSQMHGILIEGDNKFWYESGAVENVTIQNNTFINSGFGGAESYPLYASPMFTPQQRIGEGYYHRNIKFNHNRFVGFSGMLAHSLSVEGLEIIGNTLEFSEEYPELKRYPAIDINYSRDVTIRGNTATGFGRDLKIRVSEDSEGVAISNNDGFTEE